MNIFYLMCLQICIYIQKWKRFKADRSDGAEYKFRTNPLTQGSTRNGRKGEMNQRVNTINESVGRNR